MRPERHAEPPQHGAMRRARQPMQQRKERVQLDRKPTVRGRDHGGVGHSEHLTHQLALAVPRADVFDHGERDGDVDRAGPHRKFGARRLDELHSREDARKCGDRFGAETDDAFAVGVMALEEVRVGKRGIGSQPYVENRRARIQRDLRRDARVHRLSSTVGHSGGDRTEPASTREVVDALTVGHRRGRRDASSNTASRKLVMMVEKPSVMPSAAGAATRICCP